ncbi:CYTH and CHAD domain-containing protein [Labrys monachus]|uniref:Inorganic triphosphatase YgiF n=1 Tax=Labrys monachus TaxID=217067 RepID=A0ABU0FAJ7_9HYPH|nr:CYTH and CHAD domain-containing protein [Labrys monachus]MDQ0391083.1 inorganic triphosphatase YgiF [Labrys monachus]
MADNTDPLERELKFTIAAGDVDRVASHPLLASASRSSAKLSSTYFDTADRIFQQAGMSLRLRASGGRIVQTLKQRVRPAGGLQVRREDEIDRAVPEPDLDHVRRHCPPDLRKKIAGPLQPVFSVDVTRTTWSVAWEDSRIEVSLDEGTIRAGASGEPIREVEMELRQGDVGALFAVARQIAGAVDLRIEVATKSERGYRLAAGGPVEAFGAEAVSLPANATAAEAFRIIASGCLHHFAQNEAVFAVSPLPEAVHQMHVGLRRLRSLLSLYHGRFSKRERSMFRASVGRPFKQLGKARDLDIALETIRKATAEGRPAVAAGLDRRRRAEYKRLAALLSSRRFCQRRLDLLAFIEAGTLAKAARAGKDVPDFHAEAAGMLQRQWRKLGRYGRVSRLGAKRRHRLRIRAKTFRYACEFFGDLFAGPEQVRLRRTMLTSLRHLQDCLGTLNDRASAHALLPHSAGLAAGEAGMAEDRDLLDAADDEQRRLARQEPFWAQDVQGA